MCYLVLLSSEWISSWSAGLNEAREVRTQLCGICCVFTVHSKIQLANCCYRWSDPQNQKANLQQYQVFGVRTKLHHDKIPHISHWESSDIVSFYFNKKDIVLFFLSWQFFHVYLIISHGQSNPQFGQHVCYFINKLNCTSLFELNIYVSYKTNACVWFP
jgi:hypothetical protein